MYRLITWIALTLLVFASLAGCSPAPQPTATPWPPTSTPVPTAPPAPTATPVPSPALTLYYEEGAHVELVSSGGTRVLIDVYDPKALSSPATEKDILLTTHEHSDHLNAEFLAAFKGQQLYVKAGSLQSGDVTIQGVAASHNADLPPFKAEGGSDYIFIVDLDGLRLAHFGDIGQEALTAEQLAALGQVDIAVMQFSNSYSNMSADNKKGFNLMSQVKPRLIIPTHNDLNAAKYAMTLWPCLYTDKHAVKIRRDTLTDETRILFIGDLGQSLAKITHATAVDW